MKLFFSYNINDLDSKFKNTIIDLTKPPDINNWINTLYYCLKNSISCNIGKHVSTNFKGLTFNFNNKITQVDWEYLININKFINRKFKSDQKFNINTSSFYQLFLLSL